MYENLVNRLRKAAGPAIDFPDTLYDEAADAIEKLIEVIQNHEFLESLIKPRWIPVTEQLPKPCTAVIAAFDDGEVWCVWQRWSVNKDKDPLAYSTGTDLDADVTRRVTHWMPFPEPPKENGKSET